MPRASLLLLALVATAACRDPGRGDPPDTIDPFGFPVDQLGPYDVGYRAWNVTYDVLGEPRTIGMNAWYPTDDPHGTEVRYLGLQADPLVWGDARAALPLYDGSYPLMVYTHGHQGYGATSADLMRWFASHGWVAIAPDHTDNLLVDNPDDEPVHFDAMRPLDVRVAVDTIAALPDDDPLALVDTDRYVLTGHSRGCTTTWSVLGATFDASNPDGWCAGCDADQLALFDDVTDPRAVVGIPMAGTYSTSHFGADGYLSTIAPVLSMTGGNDGPESAATQWATLTGIDMAWLELEGGCHQTFALGTCETLDPAEGFVMVDTYALAFARYHLFGDHDETVVGLLDGSIELDPRATLSLR